MSISFEWDEEKARANLKKHHVSFEIATRVFLDPLALSYQDRIENGESLADIWHGRWLPAVAGSAHRAP